MAISDIRDALNEAATVIGRAQQELDRMEHKSGDFSPTVASTAAQTSVAAQVTEQNEALKKQLADAQAQLKAKQQPTVDNVVLSDAEVKAIQDARKKTNS